MARLLNGTDGITSVVSSRIRKTNVDRRPRGVDGGADGGKRGADGGGSEAAPVPAEGGEGASSSPPAESVVELIADAAEAATPQPQPAAGVLARRSLRLALNGMSRQAHQLTARGGAGWEDKTQLLFVAPDGDFDRAQLVEKLRALELVLGFELDVDPEARPGSKRGEQGGGA